MSSLTNMPSSPKKSLGEGNVSLHHTTKRLLMFEKRNFIDPSEFESRLKKSLQDPEDKTFKDALLQSYSSLYVHYRKFTDEEELINRMERNANIRTIFFRGITTLTIGFSIMIVYWVASKLGIPMPLLRIPG